ncbi:MAG: phosphatidate cytidylyltransferase [Chloroflexi bacterium]|nr:phosphatidate cytidylyltransferase [Chloroflexota bacterium]MBI4506874.1 phosphatidate cytidylyltransferase [Chloroflexota bacterium]
MAETSALRMRLRSALVAIPLVLAPVLVGGLPFLVLVAVCAAIAAMEGAAMFRERGLRPPVALAAAMALLLVLATAYPDSLPQSTVAALAALGLVLAFGWRRLRGACWQRAALEAGLAVGAALYVGGLLRYALPLRQLPLGLAWAAVVLMSTWGSDTAAYVVGRRWGRRRLAPAVSPGKTWEGALAGLAVAVGASAIVAPWLGLGPPAALALGLIVGPAAIAGDLFESALKRVADVKDAGHLMPGHGGLLDRIDSLLFVVVACYGYALLVGGR